MRVEAFVDVAVDVLDDEYCGDCDFCDDVDNKCLLFCTELIGTSRENLPRGWIYKYERCTQCKKFFKINGGD